jgi:hypothetical protein
VFLSSLSSFLSDLFGWENFFPAIQTRLFHQVVVEEVWVPPRVTRLDEFFPIGW